LRRSRILPLIAIAALALRARAELTQLKIESTRPWLGGRFEKIQGRAHFALDPKNVANQGIADLALAPVNGAGRVEFESDFVIVRPTGARKARRSALIEIPNRGLTQANGSFFSTVAGSGFNLLKLDDTSLADSFVFDQGFTVAWLGWEFDLGPGEIRAELPRAKVSSLVRVSVVATGREQFGTLGGLNSYCAADADQPDAKVLVKTHLDDAGEILPRASWAFGRMENGTLTPDPCALFFREPLTPGRIYDVVYQGDNPAIAGLGLAAVRDFAAYLKKDGTVARVLAYGYSQSGRFLRDFLYRGFNADERGKPAFDGMFIASAGAGRGSFDHRYAMPGVAGNSVLSILRPVDQPPFDDAGLLKSAVGSNTLPKIFYTYSSTEYWARYGSLAYTTIDAARELPLSANSRLYFFPGTPHSHGAFPPVKQTRTDAWANFANYASSGWSFRALLLDLDDWVAKGVKPPDSAYPHLTNGLAAREKVNFPHIPGVKFPSWMPRIWRLDFGPEFATKGIVSREPPLLGERFTALVPLTDQDGNDLGGIAIPDIAVPLGTFTGWNYHTPALPNLDYLAGLVGSFIPFPRTVDQRKTSGDARMAIAERYPDRDAYLGRVRASAKALVSRRLLRAEDLDVIVAESGSRWDYFAGQP
jgi:hypothetical protein